MARRALFCGAPDAALSGGRRKASAAGPRRLRASQRVDTGEHSAATGAQGCLAAVRGSGDERYAQVRPRGRPEDPPPASDA